MSWTQRVRLKLQTLFGRERIAQQLDDELQFHLDQQVAENVAAGMSTEEAATRPCGFSATSPS
jgi:hypothetical protein